MSRTLIFALALILEFSGVRAWAADNFDAAQAAFNDKSYTEALALFLAIEPGKADSERLNNIAVCHYHLGNSQDLVFYKRYKLHLFFRRVH